MNLSYNYLKIKKIAKEIKKTHTINSIVEIVQYIFSDDDVLSIFIKEGLDLKTTDEADNAISEEMNAGLDYFEIQQSIITALIETNFYKKELQMMLDNLQTPSQINQQ